MGSWRKSPAMETLQKAAAEWAKQALPLDANHLEKLKEELNELCDTPDSADEMADVCLALMIHATRRRHERRL